MWNRIPFRGQISDHDAFDLVDRHRVRRPVVELHRLGRRVPGDLLRVVDDGSPAAAARRLIIARTTRRCSARPVSRHPAGSHALEERHLRLLELGRREVIVEGLGRAFPPLLVEPEPPPAPLQEV